MTIRLGVIGRADDGGLGNQTREVVRHLHPTSVLWMMMGDTARGRERTQNELAEVYGPSCYFNYGPQIFDELLMPMLDEIDVLYTIEGPYHPHLHERCLETNTRLVLHANPELYKNYPCDELWLPTTWRRELYPQAQVVPFPIAADRLPRFPYRPDEPTFLHLTGPAMLDRQGTEAVLVALLQVTEPCTVFVRMPGMVGTDQYGKVKVQWLAPTAEYWDAYQIWPTLPATGPWALLQPRRYGGLSLPIQEAAACGIPTIALDREPERTDYCDMTWRLPVTEAYEYPMAGGQVAVEATAPHLLASMISATARGQWFDVNRRSSDQDRAYEAAQARSWEANLGTWQELLGL